MDLTLAPRESIATPRIPPAPIEQLRRDARRTTQRRLWRTPPAVQHPGSTGQTRRVTSWLVARRRRVATLGLTLGVLCGFALPSLLSALR